jgi:enamine deaminase RidA (YjgF/YER057c/UK114 family)
MSEVCNIKIFLIVQVIKDARPARSCVEVARLPLDVKVEIDGVALL